MRLICLAISFACATTLFVESSHAQTASKSSAADNTPPRPNSTGPSAKVDASETTPTNKISSTTTNNNNKPGNTSSDNAKTGANPSGGKLTNAKDGDATATSSKASAGATYTQALNAFKYQDFDTAIPLFRKVLADSGALSRKRRWRAREFLGAALWFNGDKVGASDQFTGLLTQNPQGRLDPAYYPPQMIADFVRVRRKMIALGMIKPNDKPAPATDERIQYQPPPRLLGYLPFGVGQIANDEIGEGIAFMVAESLLAATSLYFYDRNNRDAAQGKELSSGAKAGQLAPGIGFYVVAAWGVIDSIVARRKMNLPRVGTLPSDR